MGRTPHLLDPGPQVGGAPTQAGVLDEVVLAGRLHGAAMVPVESVQVGDILMGFLAGIDRTAGVLLPGTALGGEDTGVSSRPSTEYSHTSELVGFRPLQTLYSSHFDEKKNVSALGNCSYLLEHVGVTIPPRKGKCFIVRYQ